jgi:hypothetical protein
MESDADLSSTTASSSAECFSGGSAAWSASPLKFVLCATFMSKKIKHKILRPCSHNEDSLCPLMVLGMTVLRRDGGVQKVT